jgi:hypothetical protein
MNRPPASSALPALHLFAVHAAFQKLGHLSPMHTFSFHCVPLSALSARKCRIWS